MPRPLCSVVMATYNRCHLLERSLECYARQDFPKDRFELVIIDDHSEDDTQGLVHDFCDEAGIQYTILTTGPKWEEWRDCGAVLNAGIRAAAGDYILLTHPEVMVGRRSVAECITQLQRFESTRIVYPNMMGVYACCKPYYLSTRDQERIDTVDWLNEGPLAVRKIEGFYDEEQQGNPDYSPRSIESVGHPGAKHSHWLSWVFGGCSRETWKRMGGMLETGKWGSVDVAFVQRRRTLGIINHTCIEDDTICVHANHDAPGINVPTPRIEDLWKKELAGIPLHDAKAMQYPAIDELGWI